MKNRPRWARRIAVLLLLGLLGCTTPATTAPTPGLTLTWTRVAVSEESLAIPDPTREFPTTTRVVWLGDRFVLVDGEAVSTSTDGLTWELLDESDPGWDSYRLLSVPSATGPSAIATWENTTVMWNPYAPSPSVRILRPPDEPASVDFEGGVGAVGIGPAGMVAQVHSALDFDAYITSLLGPGWVEHMVDFSFEDGILRITTNDDRALEIVWAEHGFEPGDVADRGFGWYSPDGDHWTEAPVFPANVSDIVGVSDGFIARGVDPSVAANPFGMWHSPDGITWRHVGPATDGSVLPWGDGALVTDGTRRFDVWTAEGSSTLPMVTELPAGWTASSNAAIGTGSLGLVSVSIDRQEVLFTRNGIDWSIEPMPSEMAAATGPGRTVYYTNVAVGTDSVVVLLWAGELESAVPSLWVATLEP